MSAIRSIALSSMLLAAAPVCFIATARAAETVTTSADKSATGAPAKPADKAPPRSLKQLRDALTKSIHGLNAAKGADRAAAAKSLLTLYKEIGGNKALSAKNRDRLGEQVRTRLARFAAQLRFEAAHPAPSQVADAAGAAPKSVKVGDGILAQQAGPPAARGQGAGGLAAGGANGRQGGSQFDRDTEANGQALVDLIEQTIGPSTWEANGGPGTIRYFNQFRVLVVRQTDDEQDALGDLMNGLRR